MKILLITNKGIEKSSRIKDLEKICDLTISHLEKNNLFKDNSYNLVILLTKKILNRKDAVFLKITSFINRNNLKLIELAFSKSKIDKNKSESEAIIHGLEKMTWEVLLKIIKKRLLI